MKKITKIEVKDRKKRKERVAAYIRVSTDSKEQKLSLETQKVHYETSLKNQLGVEFIGIYADEGISGTRRDKRVGLQKLLEDAKEGRIDTIYTKSISRFARNTTECLEMVRELMALDVGIYFEKENIHTKKMEGEFMLSILASLAESESKSISQNNKWAIQNRFKNGTYIIAYPPYGYKNENGKMVVIKEEAKIVKEIFKLYLSGLGTYKIAKILNDREIPTKRNKLWHGNTILDILKNEKYTGDVLYQKTYTDENYKRHQNDGSKDQYLIKDHHENIISREEFHQTEKLMAKRREKMGGTKDKEKFQNRYAFSGKLICSECGDIFKRRRHYKKSGDYVAWTCKKHLKDIQACSMKYVLDEDIKYTFTLMMNKLLFAKKEILPCLHESLIEVDSEETMKNILILESKLEEWNKRKERLEEIFQSGILSPEIYIKENNELIKTIHELNEEKIRLESCQYSKGERKEEISILENILKRDEYYCSFDEDVFKKVVKKVFIKDRTSFLFELRCGLSFKEEV